ncbi:MAG: helix-turn-helix transcriptional regulator [Gammaproteobacteria bacterium]|nr:helix-turn-helix transcriptional regulator [Gammaproteobacteria bacterium]
MSKAETATAAAGAELPVETAAAAESPVEAAAESPAESPSARSDSGAAGQRLAAARIEWGASVGEVAAYLNLSDATIEALESGAHERLPGLTFVKGYLRAYAKLLRLDPDDIIQHAGFAPETPNDIPVAHVPLHRGRRGREQKHRLLVRTAATVAAVLAALFLAWAAAWLLPDPAVDRVLQTLNLGASDGGAAESITLPTGTAAPGFGGETVIDNFAEEDNALIIEEE